MLTDVQLSAVSALATPKLRPSDGHPARSSVSFVAQASQPGETFKRFSYEKAENSLQVAAETAS